MTPRVEGPAPILASGLRRVLCGMGSLHARRPLLRQRAERLLAPAPRERPGGSQRDCERQADYARNVAHQRTSATARRRPLASLPSATDCPIRTTRSANAVLPAATSTQRPDTPLGSLSDSRTICERAVYAGGASRRLHNTAAATGVNAMKHKAHILWISARAVGAARTISRVASLRRLGRALTVIGVAMIATLGIGLASPVSARADVPGYSTTVVGGPGDLRLTAPDGVRYVSVSVGSGYALYLRSDGRVDSAGESFDGAVIVPELPPGLSYTAVDAKSVVGVLLRSDGTIVLSGPSSDGIPVPALPAGTRYLRIASGGGFVTALRSDGRVVIFQIGPGVDGTGPAEHQYVRVTKDANYVGAVPGLGFALLLKPGSGPKKVTLPRWCPGGCIANPGASDVPRLASGVGIVSGDSNGFVTALVSSDGRAFISGKVPSLGKRIAVPAVPRGIKYTRASVAGRSVVLLRSDGSSVVTAYEHPENGRPSAPRLPMNWIFERIDARDSVAAFSARQLWDGEKVAATLSRVSSQRTARKGSSITVKASLTSMADTAGGRVRVSSRGKTLGTGVVAADGSVRVSVSTRTSSRGAHKLGVAFLSTEHPAKSNSATRGVLTIRVQ